MARRSTGSRTLLAGRDYLFGEFGVADCIAFPFLKYPVFGAARRRRRDLPPRPRRAHAARRRLPALGHGSTASTRTRGRSRRVPYYICPNCKDRSIDIDGKEGLSDEAVACRRCGFGFLFELMDDYYPAPDAGLVVCDQQGRILAVGRGVFELTGWSESRPDRRRPRRGARARAASRPTRTRRSSRSNGASGG